MKGTAPRACVSAAEQNRAVTMAGGSLATSSIEMLSDVSFGGEEVGAVCGLGGAPAAPSAEVEGRSFAALPERCF